MSVWVVGDEGPVEVPYGSKEEAIAYLIKVKEWYEEFDRDVELVIEEDKATLIWYTYFAGPDYLYALKREAEEC